MIDTLLKQTGCAQSTNVSSENTSQGEGAIHKRTNSYTKTTKITPKTFEQGTTSLVYYSHRQSQFYME